MYFCANKVVLRKQNQQQLPNNFSEEKLEEKERRVPLNPSQQSLFQPRPIIPEVNTNILSINLGL